MYKRCRRYQSHPQLGFLIEGEHGFLRSLISTIVSANASLSIEIGTNVSLSIEIGTDPFFLGLSPMQLFYFPCPRLWSSPWSPHWFGIYSSIHTRGLFPSPNWRVWFAWGKIFIDRLDGLLVQNYLAVREQILSSISLFTNQVNLKFGDKWNFWSKYVAVWILHLIEVQGNVSWRAF